MPLGGFSWKRVVGITRATTRISRATGISLTMSGRQRKIGKMLTSGGCLLPMIISMSVIIINYLSLIF